MPIEERTGEGFTQQYSYQRDELTDEERAERWLSHAALEWGDYMGGSSDVQCANAADLPSVIGVAEGSDVYREESGGFGYTRWWVRLSPAPTEEEWNGYDDRHDEDLATQWEAHVRETLSHLDDYPLFDDESHSRIVEEWAEAAWNDFGASDLERMIASVDGDFADHVSMTEGFSWESVCGLRDEFNCDPWHAEGGEGGVYIDVNLIARHLLPKFLIDFKGTDTAWIGADLLAELDRATSERRGPARGLVKRCMKYAVKTTFGKNLPGAFVDFKYDTSDCAILAFADMLYEYDVNRSDAWPEIFRTYATLPAADLDEA